MIIDTVLSKVETLLFLDSVSSEKRIDPIAIRIIDLTNKYLSWGKYDTGEFKGIEKSGSGYYKRHFVRLRSRWDLPSLNSGLYRDILFTYQQKKKNRIRLTVTACVFRRPCNSYSNCYAFSFEFKLDKNSIRVEKYEVYDDID